MPEPITLETLLAMRGQPVVDRHGDELGSIEEIYYDKATRVPEWAGVSTSFWGLKRVLVPLVDARIEGGRLHVPFDREMAKDTPSIHDAEIDEEMERQLYAHYGLDYSQHASPTGLPTDAGVSVTEAEGVDISTHQVQRWSWPEPQQATTMTGSAAGLEAEALVDTGGVDVPTDITEEPHLAGEPAAAAPYAPTPAAGGAESQQPPSAPSPAQPARLDEAPPVLTDMPADVPGTLYDTSPEGMRGARPRRKRTALVAAGVGALALGAWLINRMRRRDDGG